ncbi:MAG: GNAT family N-acetyltransferase [Rhodobacteraceae bacterium]|jgi:ribosomal-protein-alanine N-acetyltransferase|nr:GNAT family N-acetyltransferase [Paracoccaceae bacterium]
MSVEFTRDRAGAGEVLAHLLRCDASFTPPLSSRVDLAAYAEKLVACARRWEAWAEGDLVGLVAVYADAPAGGSGFVSNVSVDPARRGAGVARQLLTEAIAFVRDAGLGALDLEVDGRAEGAIALYASLGFRRAGEQEGRVRMRLPLIGRGAGAVSVDGPGPKH